MQKNPRLRALDLFCGAGGVSVGLHRAGFDVVGVDLSPQPRYPFEFVQGDALSADLSGFDFVWASPPCQRSSCTWWIHQDARHVDLVNPVREKLIAAGLPYIIENVPGAPLLNPVRLDGGMFGLGVIRQRLFESNLFLMSPRPTRRSLPDGRRHIIVAGEGDNSSAPGRGGSCRLADWRDAMGIDWMQKAELAQAIPPAYAEYLGRQVVQHLTGLRAAA